MAAVATLAFWLPFMLLPALPMVVVVLGSMLLYLGTLASFKDIRRNEFGTAVRIAKKEFDKLGLTAR
jgi:hypothetical protein